MALGTCMNHTAFYNPNVDPHDNHYNIKPIHITSTILVSEKFSIPHPFTQYIIILPVVITRASATASMSSPSVMPTSSIP